MYPKYFNSDLRRNKYIYVILKPLIGCVTILVVVFVDMPLVKHKEQ